MKRKLTYLFSFLAITIVAVLGFSTSGIFDRDPNATWQPGEYVVNGPQLESPLSTLSESFEGVTFPPSGWTKLSPDGGTGWNRQTNGTAPIPGWTGGAITVPPGGGNAVAFCTWNTGGASSNNQYLVTPQLTNVQLDDSLKFWLRYWPNSFRDSIEVLISTTTPTAAAFTTLVFRKNFAVSSPDTNWAQYKFRLGNFVSAGANIYIAFRETVVNNLADGASFSLDLVEVTSGAPPPPVTCTYGWTQQTSGTTAQFFSVSSVSDMIGWAGGAGATVRRTTDGGLTWTNANPTTPTVIVGDIYNIHAVDANTAFVTTSPSATFIYKTVNGGTTWTQVYTLAGGFINAIEMISPLIGYAQGDPTPVGGNWVILTTVNGGNNWTRMPTEPAGAGEAGWNNSFQVLGTNIWSITNINAVKRSTDLGLTWTNYLMGGVSTSTYGSVHFNNALVGLASGSAGIARTTDGGVTYTSVGTVAGTGTITSLAGYGNSHFWYSRGTGIFMSSNGGLNFASAYTPSGSILDMDFSVSGCPEGWAVGAAGGIYKMDILTGISGNSEIVPASYILKQNFPNPFNPTTNIHFDIPVSGLVTLKVFDITGREVANLVNEVKPAGSYIVDFNASGLPSGAYFYRLQTGNFVDTKKMMLLK